MNLYWTRKNICTLTSSVKVLGLSVSLCLRPAGELKTGVMAWETFAYGKGQTIGSRYSYEEKQNVLNIKEGGTYFLYVQLNFSCTGRCPSGQFTVSFYNKHNSEELSCTVSLPVWSEEAPHSQTCWRVVTFPENENRLMAKSQTEGTLDNWKLEMNDSGFGMFLVDGFGALHRTWSAEAWPNWFTQDLFFMLWWAGLH